MISIRMSIVSALVGVATLSLDGGVVSRSDTKSQAASSGASVLPAIPKVKDPAEDVSVIREAYEFVGEHPEIARYIPCFCACSRTKHHHAIEDCFVKSRGKDGKSVRWNNHAAECYICISVAQEAHRSFLSGMSTVAMRAHIERDVAPKFKYHTETPDPPTHE